MTRYGYTMMCEQQDSKSLIRNAQLAEEAGFDFAVISDHFHPWLDSQGQSPFAWSVLGAVADRFENLGDASRPKYGQVAVCWAKDEADARRTARELWRFAVSGWKVMAELPNPVNFDAATRLVSEEAIAEVVPCGPDPKQHAAAIARFAEAGFDHVAIVQAGSDQGGFLEFWTEELQPLLS